jgi:hypothetical protein
MLEIDRAVERKYLRHPNKGQLDVFRGKKKPGNGEFFLWRFPFGSTKDFPLGSTNCVSPNVSSGGFFFLDADEVEGD